MASRSKAALNGLKSSVVGLSNTLDRVGNRAFLALTAGGVLAGRTLIKTAAEFEVADIRMRQTFGKDGNKASAWLKQFATDTPMAFGEVQDAMMRLKTAGIDPMNGSLQALVDYNAKVGGDKSNLDGYISAISKGFIKGKLSMEEINPLLERNVKVFEILAAETGGKYTAEQMQKMLQEGKLGRKAIAALLRGMGKDAQGAAKEQMKTWDGLVSNFEDTITSMKAKLMEKGVFDELKNELGGILDWLNQKIDSGEFDEFAKQISNTLVTALRDLKDLSKDVKPILESLGATMSWLSEKAGGYGNLATFAAALYGANKIVRNSMVQAVGKGTLYAGKWGVGKLLGRGKGGVASAGVGGMLGDISGVTPVYVTNLSQFSGIGGGRGRTRVLGGKKANGAAKAIAATTKTATQGVKTAAKTAMLATTNVAKTAAGAMANTAKRLPTIGTGLALAEGAMILADDTATTKEKSESIGSMAGATAGAFIGQTLIPIPVLGAAIGGVLGDWLGGWLGSEVGEMLSSPEPKETKLNGEIEVKVKAADGTTATVGNTNLNTNTGNNYLHIKTTTGYMGTELYGGD
nr:MAG TPA: tail tape measure [Caudoviricetes sp.]